MGMNLLVLALCLVAVNGCKYFKNPGLLLNKFQDTSTKVVVNVNRYRNTDTAYDDNNPVAQINFTFPIEIFRSDQKNYFVRICESGYLELAANGNSLESCKTKSQIQGIGASLVEAVIIADYIDSVATNTNYQVEAYHILRKDQLYETKKTITLYEYEKRIYTLRDASNNVTGPSYCDLQILAGIISDCEMEHRNNITVYEALVVHWRSTNSTSGVNYDFQAFIAVADNNRTFVGFLYENTVMWTNVNGIAKGIIHAKNSGLGGKVRYSQICGATSDNSLHLKSNCKCAEPGHFVFETTESTVSPNGYCGTETGKDSCVISATRKASNKNDPDTSNKNCRAPENPQATCDDSYYCTLKTTPTEDQELTIFFKNYGGKDRAVFLNYTAFTEADGSTGFEAPYGSNVQSVGVLNYCRETIALDSNNTYSNVTRSNSGLLDTCFVFDSSTNVYNFVLLLYNSVDGENIYTDGSRIIVGHCDLDDLSQVINRTFKAGDIASTTVATRTGQKVTLQFRDSRNDSDSQTIKNTDTVQLGRYLFPTVCFTPALQAVPNVDAYGAYVVGCEFSNNKEFDNGTSTNKSMHVVMDNGCLPSTPADGQAGRLIEPFKIYPATRTSISSPLCQTSSFQAFRWNLNNPPSTLWMRCRVKLCVNRQLFLESKCFDSCKNTVVNVKTTDADDAGRRRRDVNGEDEIELVTSVVVVDVEKPSEVTKNCADPVMAKSVIGALVALLIISTLMTIVLFVIFQKQKQC